MDKHNPDDERAAIPSPEAAMMKALGSMIFPLAVKAALALEMLPILEEGKHAGTPALATRLGVDAGALGRLLTSLAALGVLRREGERYRVTPFGATLLPGPRSMLPLARYLLDDSVLLPLAKLSTCVQSGQPTLPQNPRTGWYNQYPERARLMDGAMAVYSGLGLPALLEAYDFSSYATLIDVGGGIGHVLAGILARYPNASGTLYDMQATTERAVRYLAEHGLQGRYAVAAGDMLKTVPAGAGLYILSKVLNNWDDEHCVRILRNIRVAMEEDARLIVIEGVIADADYAAEDAFRDLLLLACSHGGRLRTVEELRGLGGEAGLTMLRVIPTSTAFSVLEFKPGTRPR
ncbi:hypothetical protein JOD97_000459 [Duganella sp. 1411]|uniref:methyltransferase n=1 Tax=Duganella sp. 1411 TaxID=2806572 RepID=UPI001AEA8F95|nr:methyltransferase [Duganella sp. 1411]MBP1202445.1 hypothetical protein [Duganella sp. 1411]